MQHNQPNYRDTLVSDRHKITNDRFYNRVVPSAPLQPYLSVAPVQTKFTVLPMRDLRKQINEPMEQLGTFKPDQMFNPGSSAGPWSGFASSINTESILRNQVFALQKASQTVYVPSSKSDLYQYGFDTPSVKQPFSLLFENYSPQHTTPLVDQIKGGMFNNSTRTQREE